MDNYIDLRKYLEEYGFSNFVVENIIERFAKKNIKEVTILKRIRELFDYLESVGLKRDVIIYVVSKNYTIAMTTKRFAQNVIDFFSLLGYKIDDISKMFVECVWLLTSSRKKLQRGLNHLKATNLSNKTMYKAMRCCPHIILRTKLDLPNWLLNRGIPLETIDKMIYLFPIVLSINEDMLEKKNNFLKSLGFSDEDITKIVIQYLGILILPSSKLIARLDHLRSYGLTDAELNDTIRRNPRILSITEEKMAAGIPVLKEANYSDEEIKMLICSGGLIFESKLETLSTKVAIYDYYNLKSEIFKKPRQVFQSAELTLARIDYVLSLGEELIPYRIFLGEKLFEKTYGVTNDEVKRLYSAKIEVM